MSETDETKGRLRREITAAYADKSITPNQSDWLTADAIDRLAEDVAEIKAKVDSIALEDVAHLVESEKAWVRLVEEQRDAAIRERDEARAEVERLRAELAAARAETQRLQDEADDREQTEKVKRLNAEIEKTHRTLLNRTWERDIAKAEVERLRAELAARPAAGLTADDCWQLRVAAEHLKRLGSEACVKTIEGILARAGSPPGWLTDEERQALLYFRSILSSRRDAPNYPEVKGFHCNHLECVDAILARAASPPVVEVPEMTSGYNEILHNQYRAALDAAGIAWKEKPRE